MQVNALKGKMIENGLTQKDVAEAIGISLSAFNAKLNEKNNAEFNLREIRALRKLLSLNVEQTDSIFFD